MTSSFHGSEKRKWWILAAMTTAASMIMLDVTILPVALPTMGLELGISTLALQWIVNAYTLALTIFFLCGGRLADMWGMRRGFCIGLGIFTLASIFCGFSHTAEWLIFNRALQGMGGALMIPSAQGILLHSFPESERGKAMGLYVSVGAIFLALGPVLGGNFTQYLSWRYSFWINIPIATVGLVLTLLSVPKFAQRKERFDMLGFLTLAMGASALITGVMNVQSWGWTSPLTLFLLTFGIFLIVVLIRSERKISDPLIDLALVHRKTFLAPTAAVCCSQFLFMITIFWALYFQEVLHYSPSGAGFIIFLSNVPLLVSAPIAGILVDRFGARFPVILGFILMGFSLIWFVLNPTPHNLSTLLPALLPFGFGFPLISTPCFVAIMNDIPVEKRGAIAGISLSIRQFASTLGFALFGSIFHFWYDKQLTSRIEANPQIAALDPTPFSSVLTQTPDALHLLEQMPPEIGNTLKSYISVASIDAFNVINFIAACIALIGIIIAFLWIRRKPVHSDP